MKNSFWIFIVLVVLFLASCTKQAQEVPSDIAVQYDSQETTEVKEDDETINDVLGNILKLDGKYKCSIIAEDVQSVVYVDRENSRSETILPSGGISYSISKKIPNGDICTFTWIVEGNAPENQVIKMCINQEEIQNCDTG